MIYALALFAMPVALPATEAINYSEPLQGGYPWGGCLRYCACVCLDGHAGCQSACMAATEGVDCNTLFCME